ncbi:MAG: oxygen-independent coproporphyrinogen III oxidase [Prochloraceae cyanobacterium]|nr:oxygen-independent coproporphyrinogen III oxidase [Prochloraceae cyanobacterium]
MQVEQKVAFDSDLIKKYDKAIPRYTSYPPATEFSTEFTEADYREAIARNNLRQAPLSLYFHIPFCETLCYYCGCNTIITKLKEKVVPPYLKYLFTEIERVSPLIDRNRTVNQLHWGGGTPNYLNAPQVESLWNKIQEHYTFEDNAEISLEVNPEHLDKNYVLFLRSLGFNRISFGVQDFNPKVQEAINRVQPEKMLFDAMDWMRSAGFEGVNIDLIYGLPYQNLETFRETIQKVIKLNPDRIALFNFAYLPTLRPAQKKFPIESLPQPAEKLAIFQMTIEELAKGGYLFIGMDHFAKPDDELAIAQEKGVLHRNFQGYTTKPESELFAFGVTSVSMLHDIYVQNHKNLKEYYQAIDENRLPIARGVKLTPQDILRRDIIKELMCNFKLKKQAIADKYNLDNFDRYFATELEQLKTLADDGLLTLKADEIEISPIGRLLVRNIAYTFDTHTPLRKDQRFSRSI